MAWLSDPKSAIEEYARKSLERRRGKLPQQEWAKLDLLEDQIRDLIDGSHPSPRRIENPAAAAPSRSGPAIAPARISITPSADSIAEPPRRVELSETDLEKLTELSEDELPRSGYTPPVDPAYLADYYSTEISLGAFDARAVGVISPKRMVGAAGETELPISQEGKLLFGISAARPTMGGVRPGPITGSSFSAPPGPASDRVPCIVHLLVGGFKRGECIPFDPELGSITVRPNAETEDETIPLEEVLAIFFAVPRGGSPREPSGQRLIIKLVNDRDMTGMSADYAPGAQALTLVPDERRGSVDRVWIPAWSVKAIELG